MADPFASLKSILSGDGTLSALLTAGVFDDSDTGVDGITPTFAQNNSLINSTTGVLSPLAYIAWSTDIPQDLNSADGRAADRFVFVYLYDDNNAGYSTIETAALRVITLLNQVARVADTYSHKTRYVDGSQRLVANDMFDAALLYRRFVDSYGR